MEDSIKDPQQTQQRMTPRPPTVVGKENPQTAMKERVWQDELLEAYLPRALDESQQHMQLQTDPNALQQQQDSEIKNETKKSKVVLLAPITPITTSQDQKLVSIIKMSVFVSLLTAFLLWFFEPSFVQSVRSSNIMYDQKDLILMKDGEIYVSSRIKLLFWSILAGVFAFSVLYSVPD
jgi:hypothetical protein